MRNQGYLTLAVLVIAVVSFNVCTSATRNENSTKLISSASTGAVNINTATAAELETLPHIGDTLARRIIEFREHNGPFRRPENLLLVDGIREKRFREIRPLITTE